MTSSRKPPLMRLIFKTTILLGCLGAVIWLTLQIRSDSFRQALESFFPPDAAWAWCPKNVHEVRWAATDQVVNQATAHQFCVVEMESVDSDVVGLATLKPILRVIGTGDTVLVLEGDLERGIFQVQGLPFRSPSLEKALKAYAQP